MARELISARLYEIFISGGEHIAIPKYDVRLRRGASRIRCRNYDWTLATPEVIEKWDLTHPDGGLIYVDVDDQETEFVSETLVTEL